MTMSEKKRKMKTNLKLKRKYVCKIELLEM